MKRTSLSGSTSADVCVVGAGIAGLSVAHGLTAAGSSVVVLDERQIGSGETGHTSAHLVSALDDRFTQIERLHGERGAMLAAESHAAAIDHVESVARDDGIECGFDRVDGYLWVPPEIEDARDLLDEELEAARRAGVRGVAGPVIPPDIVGVSSALRFADQAQFHPLRYLRGLARLVEMQGGRIFTGSCVMKVHGGSEAYVETESGARVRCKAIVVATNVPRNDIIAVHTKQTAYRTYLIALSIPRGAVQPALFWDGFWPGMKAYHYVRVIQADDGEELLLCGGEDHPTGRPPEEDQHDELAPFKRLEQWARRHFPASGPTRFAWSGQVLEPYDAMGFIGRNPRDHDNVFIVTGDSGTGLTHGTIAGLMLPTLIGGREHRWESLYDPARITLRAAGSYTRDNVVMAAQYADWLRSGEVSDESEIQPGTGAVMRHGLKRVAVYRTETGELVQLSAVCPHLGGVVRWNPTERTWDCPCHGSRFDCSGRVLNGPAPHNLARIERPIAPATQSSVDLDAVDLDKRRREARCASACDSKQ